MRRFNLFQNLTRLGIVCLLSLNPRVKSKNLRHILRNALQALTNYLVDEATGRDLAGLRIRNTENAQDKVVGISLRHRGLFNPFVGGGKHASHLKEVVPVDMGNAIPTFDL